MNPNRENPHIRQEHIRPPSREQIEREANMTLQELDVRIQEIVTLLENVNDNTEHANLVAEMHRLNERKNELESNH